MGTEVQYDLFLSFAAEAERDVRLVFDAMKSSGLNPFWAERSLQKGVPFPEPLEEGLKGSQHFVIFCSKNCAKKHWINEECNTFLKECHQVDPQNRRMYVILPEGCKENDIPTGLKSINRHRSPSELIADLVRDKLRRLQHQLKGAELRSSEVEVLQEELGHAKRKVEEARGFYRYNRFWGPLAHHQNLNIFTCARDVPHAVDLPRGYGGRTNIDMWDYVSVLDITHFFASTYPSTTITIEDPLSKLNREDLSDPSFLAERIAYVRSTVEGKNCVVIGSPDVSDFAEIVLAQVHGIPPYREGRLKHKGFVLIKERQHPMSSFYWQKEPTEHEGVAQIRGPGDCEYYDDLPATEDGTVGKQYGILVVAHNPFCRDARRGRIVILSGFSGVATNAMSKLLTDETHLSEFFKLDEAYADMERNIEALIGVEYTVDSQIAQRDTRKLKAISVEKVIEI